MEDAVEIGVEMGWNRAHKHEDNPSEQTIQHHIQEALMQEICERFEFEPTLEQDENLLRGMMHDLVNSRPALLP